MTQNTFWEELEKWPTDSPGWLFLGRASILLGDEMYDGWGERGFAERWRLGWSVANHDSAISVASARNSNWSESEAAEEIWNQNRQQYNFHSGRVDSVQQQLREWAESGQLPTAVRDTGGGPLILLEPVAWSTQSLSVRFYCCQMNLAKPYGHGVFGEGFQHIFVKQEQFMTLAYPDEKLRCTSKLGQPVADVGEATAPPQAVVGDHTPSSEPDGPIPIKVTKRRGPRSQFAEQLKRIFERDRTLVSFMSEGALLDHVRTHWSGDDPPRSPRTVADHRRRWLEEKRLRIEARARTTQ